MARFLADEHVPNDVIDMLRDRGHEVLPSREVLGEKAPDAALIEWAATHRAAVITKNVRDFKKIKRTADHRGAGAVFFEDVREARMLERLLRFETHWTAEIEHLATQKDRRLIVVIRKHEFIVQA